MHAPTLPSDDPAAHLADWLAVVGPQEHAVVVGHSFGGVMLPLVPALAHVYLCAFVPTPGHPPTAILSDALDAGFGGVERDELGRSYWPSLEVAAERLYRGHAPSWAEWAYEQLRPQAQTVAHDPCAIASLPPIPTASILARADPSIRPAWSRERARNVLGVEAHELDGGHFPMFDRTGELADLLEGVLEQLP